MAQFNVKDIDAASSLATKLSNLGENINAVCTAIDKTAEDVLALDQTAHLNEQLSDYLKEASENLRKLTPGLEDAGTQLSGIVSSAAQFEEAASGNALGQC